MISLWNFPKAISDYKIDSEKNTFSFSGAHFKLPLLLSVMPNKIEPKLDAYLATPLKQQLARFAPDEKFVWIDRCYKIGSVWDDKLIMNNGLCVANGTLNAHPTIIQVKPGNTLGKITFSKGEQSDDRYQRSLTRLKIADADLKYASDSIQFNLPGLPQQVQKVSGLSYAENWGRWSDANLLPDVTIQYLEPLPAKFALTMSARAFGNNSLRPVQVRVGDWQQQVTFGAQDTTMTLQVDNPSRARSIVITPPEPIETSEGTVDGFAARKLGIGLVSLKVTAQP